MLRSVTILLSLLTRRGAAGGSHGTGTPTCGFRRTRGRLTRRRLAGPSCCGSLLFVDPSSFLLGALLVSAKVLGIGAVGFGIAWWRARSRIRQLETKRQPDALLDRMDRLEGALDSVAAALEQLQRRLPPPRAGS